VEGRRVARALEESVDEARQAVESLDCALYSGSLSQRIGVEDFWLSPSQLRVGCYFLNISVWNFTGMPLLIPNNSVKQSCSKTHLHLFQNGFLAKLLLTFVRNASLVLSVST
jgi:hypothetical protein